MPRAVWIARHGPIPAETPFVLHRCDNPPCFRDEHLWLGTQADNQADMAAKGRAHGEQLIACGKGHLFDDLNTYRTPVTNRRFCRACNREAVKRYKERRASRRRPSSAVS